MAHSDFLLRHPEHIHPALWRATQVARPAGPTVPTGYPLLDNALPGRGWPVGQLIEVMPNQPGCGELQLFRPALARQAPERSIALVQPPHPPCTQAWAYWQLAPERLLWLQPSNTADALWATEQILRHNCCAAVFCWAHPLRSASLRRLQLLARQSETLCILLRPATVIGHSSTAVLRLAIQPVRQGLQLHILKRQGAACPAPLTLQLYASHRKGAYQHAVVDLPEMA
ncbi:translesion DNA synthesis-associated protein ImuA [Achromobacter sp. F4_2707]|uniref:translesion DNA synthesis-associated protein ImuA n=1 Tax=Achromobacter sp. F4_2707 TaxID=3114286 RepID=UPI0039C70351